VTVLAAKLVLTPILVTSASLAGRRWGALIGGWLLALPLTSGPIALFIALELGPRTAAETAAGSLLGAIGHVVFCVTYAITSRRSGWLRSLAAGSIGFAAVGILVPSEPAVAIFIAILAAVVIGLRLVGADRRPSEAVAVQAGRWDIPARVVVATALVVAISSAAPTLGGRASGILATFPVYIAVLSTFAHRTWGPAEAVAVLRGLMLGLPGFASFFLALTGLLEAVSIPAAFGLALLAGVVVQAATWPLIRPSRRAPSPTA
jgi:hypothetical protein